MNHKPGTPLPWETSVHIPHGSADAQYNALRAPSHAYIALGLLQNALTHCKLAGACYTAARIRAAISSAKGAVRAAQYRQARAARKGQS